MDFIKKRKLDDDTNNTGPLPDPAVPNQLTPDDARSLLSSLTHDHLLSIVESALLRHPDVLSAVRSLADADPARRKLFVRGLGWDTTTDKLRSLFSLYGDIEEAIVILDKATGKSKGYGFVTMKHADGALLALKEPSKQIDGRMTVTQLAAAGMQGGGPVAGPVPGGAYDVSNRKIYVANVPYDMPGERLLAHFSSYGEVEEGPLGYDKATGKSRGYALFVYKSAEAARASLVDPIKTVDGHQLSCKLANEGKRGKPEGMAPGVAPVGPGEAQGNNGFGMHPPSVMAGGPVGGHYGGPGGGSYGGFSGGPQLGHHPMNSPIGPGLSSVSSQGPSSMGVSSGGPGGYGSGLGGPYGGSHFGGPGSTGYGGASGLGTGGGGLVSSAGGYGGSGGGMVGSAGGFGGAGGGMVGNAGGLGGAGGGLGASGGSLGGAGRGGSLYGGLPPSSVGLPSGGYPDSSHYSLSSSGYGSQQNHPSGTSPATRVPPGGMYQGGHPYY